jgi:hypothetical protein
VQQSELGFGSMQAKISANTSCVLLGRSQLPCLKTEPYLVALMEVIHTKGLPSPCDLSSLNSGLQTTDGDCYFLDLGGCLEGKVPAVGPAQSPCSGATLSQKKLMFSEEECKEARKVVPAQVARVSIWGNRV